ncbi:uncharacterized protein UBRO_20515 [Ustilago bromivora]|uniref:Uncharacterized protein n=1 Tax=Ustilago bromivora TaxID=307758 RepID=A0A1K0FZ26_9BASI|nr:uncharacterized protein UBRO_20515 [Ustilago bromivora]
MPYQLRSHPKRDPSEPPAAPAPLEPLFLGMDDDYEAGSPSSITPSPVVRNEVDPPRQVLSPIPPPINMYDIDARQPPQDLSTPEHQAAWEAELARSPTPPPPPPAADDVIDAILASTRAATPEYHLEVQPLTPPSRWIGHQTPPPPPPDRHLPTNGEIAGWAERFVAVCLGPAGNVANVTIWEFSGLGHCERNIPAHPGMEYLGDGTPSLQPCGSHQAE